jgi:hypothetical protein
MGQTTYKNQGTPGTPPTGYTAIYPKTDKKIYQLDDTGTEKEVGSGASPGLHASTHTDGTDQIADATQTDSGLMSDVDKTKLDSVTGNLVGDTDAQTLSNKTLTTPVISDFSNAGHDHSDVANGGAVDHSDLSGVTSDQHHSQLHTVDSHSDTSTTGSQLDTLVAGLNTTLHFHDSDRDRSNHSGTQSSSTISDFDTEVSNNTDVSANTTHRGSSSGVHGITGSVVGDADAQTLSNKTLTAPIIGDFSNAGHDHSDVANGDTINHGDLSSVTSDQHHPQLHTIDSHSDTSATGSQLDTLVAGLNTTLHFHDSDRDRSNHSGTQLASTISDFDTEVSNNTDVSANTTHRGSDGKDHSDVVLNNTHRSSDGKDHSDVVLNNTHRSSDGTDHGFIDQDLQTTASPSWAGVTISGITQGSILFAGSGGAVSQDNANLFFDDTNDYIGLGTNTPADRVGVKSAGGTAIAQLGSTLLTNGDFATDLSSWTAGAGWSWSSGTALHTAGNTATLTQGVAVTSDQQYQAEVTISGRTAGTVTASFPGSPESASLSTNATHTFTFRAASTSTINLTFTPTTDFDGALDDVSFKLITPASTYDLAVYDSTGARSGATITAGLASLNNSNIGVGAGRYNTTGSNNVNQGYQAGYNNTTGSSNINQGYQTGYSNTTGTANVNQGYLAGYSGTTCSNNVNQGYQAGYSNTTGSNNVNQGYQAGYSNTTGGANINQGYLAGYNNTTGSSNVNQGQQAGYNNTAGHNNVNQGRQAGELNTTGSNNVNQGRQAGRNTSTGAANETSSNCTMLGYDTRVNASGDTNETAIGNGAIGIGSNTVTLGNSAVTQTRLGGIASTINGGVSSGWINNALSMGHDSSSHVSWIQSGGNPSGTDLLLNQAGGKVAIGTDDLDGTPDAGTLTIKGDTNDGSTYPLVLRDSGDVNVFTVDSDGDVSISGETAFYKAATFISQRVVLLNDVLLRFGNGVNDCHILQSTAQANNTMIFGAPAASLSFVFTDQANKEKNHDLAAQIDPTLFLFSATNPDTDNTQYGYFQHDRTDFVIGQATGATKLAGAVKHNVTTVSTATYTVLADDHTLHVTYTGTGTIDITLPDSFATDGRQLVVMDAGW